MKTMTKTTGRAAGVGRAALAVAGWAMSLTALAGCSAGPLCQNLGDCGGNPLGIWASVDTNGQSSGCVDGPYFQPTNVTSPGSSFDQTLFGRPAPTAGQPLAPTTLADWCEGLELQKDPTKPFAKRSFVFQDPTVTSFQVAYNADSTYQAGFVRTARASQDYSRMCLTQVGWDPTDCASTAAAIMKDDLDGKHTGITCTQTPADGLCSCTWTDATAGNAQVTYSGAKMYCETVGTILNREGTDETFKDVVCQPDTLYGDGGCTCGFKVTFPSGGDIGYYKVDGNIITHYPENTGINYSSQTVFCQQGDTLEVSGEGVSYLFNKPPVRTFVLKRFTPPAATP